jgi:signal-transduction protein with cAMP-binding, CBS, and nucleotidyltransferase domain
MDKNQHIFEAVEIMNDKNTRHITVTENDSVVGILTIKNIFSYYMKLFGLEL